MGRVIEFRRSESADTVSMSVVIDALYEQAMAGNRKASLQLLKALFLGDFQTRQCNLDPVQSRIVADHCRSNR